MSAAAGGVDAVDGTAPPSGGAAGQGQALTVDEEALAACLPAELRGPATTITRIVAGLSGAGVYRVIGPDGAAYVLKIASAIEPAAELHRKRAIQQLAAAAGVAPRVVHVDDERRAIVSAFVADRSLPALLFNPQTHAHALALLADAIRGVHAIPLGADAVWKDPRDALASFWSRVDGTAPPFGGAAGRGQAPTIGANFPLPAFVVDAVRGVLADAPPARDRDFVLSHNDMNPSNLVYDGERVVLLDWDTAGANDPFYDLAAVALFLRFDDDDVRALIAAYDQAPVAPAGALPARFVYNRRLVAALCGTIFLHLARAAGHTGATGDESLATTPTLGEIYLQMRAGTLRVAAPAGQWAFGLALVKASLDSRPP